jgi:hypothetical protein
MVIGFEAFCNGIGHLDLTGPIRTTDCLDRSCEDITVANIQA